MPDRCAVQPSLRPVARRDLLCTTGSAALLSRSRDRPSERNPMSTRTASIDLPPTSASVTAARRLVRGLLAVWDVPHDADEAALLVTELVANVVDHVQGEVDLTLELSLSDTWLRIAVVD